MKFTFETEDEFARITRKFNSKMLGDLIGSPPHDFNSDEEMRSRKGRGGYKAQAAKRKFKTGAWRKVAK